MKTLKILKRMSGVRQKLRVKLRSLGITNKIETEFHRNMGDHFLVVRLENEEDIAIAKEGLSSASGFTFDGYRVFIKLRG